jgi:hypothetical protein
MKEDAKRRSCRAREAHRAQSTNAVGEPAFPSELAIFAWLLDPPRLETMRRRFIDGKGGAMERWVWKFAYSKPLAPEHGISGMIFKSIDQHFSGVSAKPGQKYLNLPPGTVERSGRPQAGAESEWANLALRLHQAAWALVQDPEYVVALQRRIDDGKAPVMERLLCEITEQNSRKPETWRPRKLLSFLSKHPPFLMDFLAERERIMIEAQEAEEALQARAREAARTKQATAPATPPDDPSDGEVLEVYEEP